LNQVHLGRKKAIGQAKAGEGLATHPGGWKERIYTTLTEW